MSTRENIRLIARTPSKQLVNTFWLKPWLKLISFGSNFFHLAKVFATINSTGPRSAVGNVSGYRCVSDCRSRGREFDPGPVPYFRGD